MAFLWFYLGGMAVAAVLYAIMNQVTGREPEGGDVKALLIWPLWFLLWGGAIIGAAIKRRMPT